MDRFFEEKYVPRNNILPTAKVLDLKQSACEIDSERLNGFSLDRT